MDYYAYRSGANRLLIISGSWSGDTDTPTPAIGLFREAVQHDGRIWSYVGSTTKDWHFGVVNQGIINHFYIGGNDKYGSHTPGMFVDTSSWQTGAQAWVGSLIRRLFL